MVRELFALAQRAQQQFFDEAEEREGRKPLERAKLLPSQQWYFFSVATFWMYLRWPPARHIRMAAMCGSEPLLSKVV